MSRVFFGWILAGCFLAAQTHAQHQRLLRAQAPSSFVGLTGHCEQQQPLPTADHFGCSTTRALKPSLGPAWTTDSREALAPLSVEAEQRLQHRGLRAEPPPMRAAERPVLRV